MAGGAFYSTCVVVALGVPLLVWTFFQSSLLYFEIFFLGCLCHCSSHSFRLQQFGLCPFSSLFLPCLNVLRFFIIGFLIFLNVFFFLAILYFFFSTSTNSSTLVLWVSSLVLPVSLLFGSLYFSWSCKRSHLFIVWLYYDKTQTYYSWLVNYMPWIFQPTTDFHLTLISSH